MNTIEVENVLKCLSVPSIKSIFNIFVKFRAIPEEILHITVRLHTISWDFITDLFI